MSLSCQLLVVKADAVQQRLHAHILQSHMQQEISRLNFCQMLDNLLWNNVQVYELNLICINYQSQCLKKKQKTCEASGLLNK